MEPFLAHDLLRLCCKPLPSYYTVCSMIDMTGEAWRGIVAILR